MHGRQPVSDGRKHIFVLSLDGGGLRGAFTAALLARLEERLSAQNPGASVRNAFHLFAGASTGAILASGLALGETGQSLLEFYLNEGPQIFSRRKYNRYLLARRIPGLRQFVNNNFSDKELCRILQTNFGSALERNFGVPPAQSPGQPTFATLSGLDANLLVPVFGVNAPPRGGPSDQLETLVLVGGVDHERAMRRAHEKAHRGEQTVFQTAEDIPIWEAVRASSAAPTYLDPWRIRQGGGIWRESVDGGVFANNPSLLAGAYVRHVIDDWIIAGDNIRRFHIHLLSIGTGRNRAPFKKGEASRWSTLDWISGKRRELQSPIINMMMLGQSETAREILDTFATVNQCRIQFDIAPVARMFGGDLYEMTDPDIMQVLVEYAHRIADPHDTEPALAPQKEAFERFLDACAQHGPPHHRSIWDTVALPAPHPQAPEAPEANVS